MVPITPSGVRTRSIFNPLSKVPPSMIFPTGSAREITWRTSFAMPFRRSSVNNRRSIKASDKPFCFAISISFWFAARIRSACCSNCSAIILSARFFSVVFNCAKIKAASLACLPICSNISNPLLLQQKYGVAYRKNE